MLEDVSQINLVNLFKAYYENPNSNIQVFDKLKELFEIEYSVWQGCLASPILFNFKLDWIMKEALNKKDGMAFTAKESTADLKYADDCTILFDSELKGEEMIKRADTTTNMPSLVIKIPKVKYLSPKNDTNSFIHLNRGPINKIKEFKHLRSLMDATDRASKQDLGLDQQSLVCLRATAQMSLAKKKEIELKTKIRIHFACIHSIP